MNAPGRSLASVLRDRLATPPASIVIAEVTAIPDGQHVTVEVAGVATVVPRLVGYAPVVGDACYLFVTPTLALAVGAVR